MYAVVFVVLLSIACVTTAQPTPTAQPTYTPQPTYTSAPTYTPQPTFTSVPTVLPKKTDVPKKSEALAMDCPAEVALPSAFDDQECWVIDLNVQAVGITYFDNGDIVAIGVSMPKDASDNIMDKSARFVYEQAQGAGWDLDDLQGATETMTSCGTWHTYGTIQTMCDTDGETLVILYILQAYAQG
jgi:hypothetical protein